MREAAYKLLTKALARGLRTPPYLILFLSDSCWMRCSHCWFNEEWKDANLKSKRLEFDEISRLADSIDRLLFLSMTGGEAFARPDVVEISTLFAKKTRLARYQIPTSGFKPELIVDRAERMLVANRDIPFRVDVSVDGMEDTHEEIRRIEGGFGRAMETIRGLNRLKARYSYFDVGVITTISGKNQHQVQEIAEHIAKVNPDGEWMVNITRGEVRDRAAKDVDVENYFEAHRLIRDRIESGAYAGHQGHTTASWLSAKNATRRKIIRRVLEGGCRTGGCAAGSLGGVIYSDGTVKPCELLDDELGNLRDHDYDLGAIWNSSAADASRDWIQDTRCTCTQECFLSVSMLIQPQHWPDIVRERMRLAKGGGPQTSPLLEIRGASDGGDRPDDV
jgi:MoaA/NifB/PqqE/SkfB family radical SAM enzyme